LDNWIHKKILLAFELVPDYSFIGVSDGRKVLKPSNPNWQIAHVAKHPSEQNDWHHNNWSHLHSNLSLWENARNEVPKSNSAVEKNEQSEHKSEEMLRVLNKIASKVYNKRHQKGNNNADGEFCKHL